jgi:hypothetical protein
MLSPDAHRQTHGPVAGADRESSELVLVCCEGKICIRHGGSFFRFVLDEVLGLFELKLRDEAETRKTSTCWSDMVETKSRVKRGKRGIDGKKDSWRFG